MTDQEIIDRIRLLLGNPDEETLPDLVIQTFLDIQKLYFDYPEKPETLPYVIYNTLVSCVKWLLAREVTSGEGDVTRRREKIGQEEIEVETSGGISSWQDFLDFILANPDYVDPDLSGSKGLVIIGGTRKDEYRKVKHNPNSMDTYSSGNILDRLERFGCGRKRYKY